MASGHITIKSKRKQRYAAAPITKDVMFLKVIKIAPLLLALSACSYSDEKYEWFERRWVSDTDATLEANRVNGVTEENLAPFKPLYGKLQWLVVGRTITVIHPEGNSNSFTYELKQVADSVLEFEGSELHTTPTGFCMYPIQKIPRGPFGEVQLNIECFREAGT